MPLMKVYAKDFQMGSSWSYGEIEDKNTKQKKKGFTSGPTLSTATVNFAYSLESGSRLLGARVSANVNNPVSGISTLTANGNAMTKRGDGSYSANVAIGTTAGVLTVAFKFRSNGKAESDTNTHVATAQFTNVFLEIDYEGIEGEYEGGSPSSSKGYSVPPQSVCIFDQTDNTIYTFDGVMKIQHNLAMDMQEEVSGEKAQLYVNNAKNEPDKLSLDVMMSDVYTGGGSIIGNAGSLSAAQQDAFTATKYSLIRRDSQNPWTRSESAYYTLHWLKEERRKLSVITPQFVYTDMILTTVTVNHEDTTPFGWEGQLTFQHAFEPKKKKQEKASGKDVTTAPTAAFVSGGDKKKETLLNQ